MSNLEGFEHHVKIKKYKVMGSDLVAKPTILRREVSWCQDSNTWLELYLIDPGYMKDKADIGRVWNQKVRARRNATKHSD